MEPSALHELASDRSSRKRFLRMAGGSAVAAGLSAVLAACGGKKNNSPQGASNSALAQFGQGDAGIVSYALFLEYLETQFYAAAIKSGKLTRRSLALAKQFGAEEAQHVAALEGAVRKLGGKLPAKPNAKFPLTDERTILETAGAVENLGAAAYLGQVDRIASKEVLAVALAIHTVEGRHAAVLSAALGHAVTPDGPFAHGASAEDVTGQVQTFLSG